MVRLTHKYAMTTKCAQNCNSWAARTCAMVKTDIKLQVFGVAHSAFRWTCTLVFFFVSLHAKPHTDHMWCAMPIHCKHNLHDVKTGFFIQFSKPRAKSRTMLSQLEFQWIGRIYVCLMFCEAWLILEVHLLEYSADRFIC